MKKNTLITIASILGVLIVLFLLAVGQYNKAVSMDEAVKSQWAQVENQLQRRYDLIPNLVETVKGFAGQEKTVFLGVAEARKAYFQASQGASVAEKAKAAGQVEGALSRLLLLQEKYPELKSNENFMKLQDSLEGTENRIAVERMRYNESVKQLNTYTRRFFGRMFAAWAGVEKAEYFEVPEAAKAAPQVKF